MRDIVVILVFTYGSIQTFKKPYIGILLWCWISYMNPHRLSFGFAYGMPFAYITAILIIISMLFSKEVQKPPLDSITIPWIIFLVFMSITTLNAFYPEEAGIQYLRVIKIQFMIFLTLMLITDLTKLNHLLAVIAFSIGFYSVKGGVFTILTGGSKIVWGPPESFIEGNNELAIASLMTIPLMVYLHRITDKNKKWLKMLLIASIGLTFIAALGTQSRGALVAVGAVALFFWFKSNNKLISFVIMAVLSISLYSFMPASWHSRMDTIKTYEADASAMGRLNAWEYAYHAANHNVLGMGFDSWSPLTFAMYAPNPLDVHAAHSIYFSVLADHGWIGLFLFVLILLLTWNGLNKVVKNTTKKEELKDINFLAAMLQVSMIAYMVGGAFLSLSYFDLPWHIISFAVLLKKFADQQLKATPANSKNIKNELRAIA